MRGVVQGLVALLLVGCSRDNPWFVLNTAGAVETESSPSGTTSVDSSHGETGSAASSVGVSSEDGSTAASSSSTTSSTSTTSTTGEPDTSSTSTSDSGLTSSSDSSTSTDGTTGEPGEKVLLDLYEQCPFAIWSDDLDTYKCPGDPNVMPWVAKDLPLFEGLPVKAIIMVPQQTYEDYLDGHYDLDITGAAHPYFHATVWLPIPADPADVMIATVYTEADNVVPAYTKEIKVLMGLPTVVDLDLKDLVGQVTSVALHVQITIQNSKIGKAKALWINPKVIDLP